MGKINTKNLIKRMTMLFAIVLLFANATSEATAESLYALNLTQTYYSEPKSLFGGVRARSVGDLVTIILSETISFNDSLSFNSDRSANTVDNFTNMINKILPGKPLNDQFNNFVPR